MVSPDHIKSIVEALEIYDIERPLGTGGMGTVHLLKNTLTGRQYAGKVCILPNSADHRLFLEELRVWIDLPVHPHLAACYFFRNVDDRVLIFAEYLSGGSIADRLRSGGLETIEQILDVSIQSTRGLRALHELGYVHGDVKPGNILMSGDDQVKVADFGLAFSRRRIPSLRHGSDLYRSPEQLSETISQAADVWSWGLTVLEMFTRQPIWLDGNAAPIALREYLRRNGNMPSSIVALLKRCFEWNPERRWTDMAEIEAELLAIYHQITDRTYARVTPVNPRSNASPGELFGLHHTSWPAPQTWFQWLWEQKDTDGEAPTPLTGEELNAPESRTAQALSDLIAYEDVLSTLQMMAVRQPELKQKLAQLHLCRGQIFQHLHDYAAASSAFERAIGAYNEAPAASEDERVGLLGRAWADNAGALGLLGRWEDALAALHEARRLYAGAADNEGLIRTLIIEALVRSGRGEGEAAIDTALLACQTAFQESTGQWREVDMAAGALSALGVVAHRWGQRERAAEVFDSAVENYENLLTVCWTEADVENAAAEHPDLDRSAIRLALSIQLPNHQEVLSKWSQVAALYCAVLVEIGRAEEAKTIAVRGIEKLESLEPWLNAAFSERLAAFYLSLGQAELLASRMEQSVLASSKSVELYTELVGGQGRNDLGADLGKAYANWSTALFLGGNLEGGIEILDRASSLFEAYHGAWPSQDTAHNWARIVVNRGIAELQRMRYQVALEFFDQAVDLYGAVRGELASILGDLAWARASRAYARVFLGDVQGALEDLNYSVPIMNAEAKRTGRVELVNQLDRIRVLWGDREWGRIEDEVSAAEPNRKGYLGKWTLVKRWFGK
jgi:serine/threonine protein kinase